jgi:class 3 adenylate cyclase
MHRSRHERITTEEDAINKVPYPPMRHTLTIAQLFCLMALAVLAAGCQVKPNNVMDLASGWEYTKARASTSVSTTDSLNFSPIVKISELTTVAPEGGVVILRNRFDLTDAMMKLPNSVVLGRIVKADSTFLNGSFLGRTGNFPPNVTNPWNINRIYAAPTEVLRKENNELLVKIYFEPGRGGIFNTPQFGDREYLENYSKLKTFYYEDTYKISSLVSVLASIIFFIIFLKRRNDRHFLYFSIAILSFAIWGTYHYVWSLPFLSDVAFFDSLLFQKVLWIALFGFGYYNSIFLYEFLDRHKYKILIKIVYSLLIFTISGLIIAWSPKFLETFRKIALLGIISLAFITVYWIITATRDKVPYARSVLFFFVVFASMAITDIFIDVLNLYLPYTGPISMPIYLAGMGIVIINQYVDANNEVERISRVLDVKNVQIEEKNVELLSLNQAYSRFVPNEFLHLLDKESVVDIQLGDQVKYNMTVLFSDIRDFTSISEKLSPSETFEFLNSYLEKVGPIVRSNNGYIDKYIGDSIMALFPKGPDDAINAALEIGKRLSTYNEKRVQNGEPVIRIGTGIHSGSVILGTIGEMERMEGTVISDAVNLAARLEGLNKHYGTSILLTQSTYEMLPKHKEYRHRKLDKVRVKGKEHPVRIIEIYDIDSEDTIKMKDLTSADFEKALQYYERKNIVEAQVIFESILKKFPEDGTSIMYLERCVKYGTTGLPPEGEMIEVMSKK